MLTFNEDDLSYSDRRDEYTVNGAFVAVAAVSATIAAVSLCSSTLFTMSSSSSLSLIFGLVVWRGG